MPPVSSAPPRPKPLHPLRILYADDFAELRNFMRTLMIRNGHLIETVPDGAAALAWLERAGAAADLLITDHHMPVMNGLELVRGASQTEFTGRIVVFSSKLDETAQEAYRRLGVDLIVSKSISPATLCRALDELFTPEGSGAVRRKGSRDLVLA